ncbi:MAG: transcription factor [Desulfurococcales archaeon]|nr:transcription factor [Desulfurococcales archaeon]
MSGEEKTNADYIRGLEMMIYRLSFKNEVDPEKAVRIFRLIASESRGRGLSDEDLESLTGYRQGEIRKILRMFYDLRIAGYRRGRHPETGATRYYWSIDSDSINVILVSRKKAVLQKLVQRLNYERENAFYVCPNDKTRYTFDEAFEYEFTCPKCGFLLEEDNNSKYIEVLENRIREIKKEIEEDEKKIYST